MSTSLEIYGAVQRPEVPAHVFVPERAREGVVRFAVRSVLALRGAWRALLYGSAFILLFGLLIWPLMTLAWGAFNTASPLEGGGTWTLDGFRDMWLEINTSGALVNSLVYAGLTTFFAVSIALVLCFLSERTDAPLRSLITPAVVLCAATSALFYAIGYSLLANRFTGVLNLAVRDMTGIGPLLNVESWPGLVFVDSLHGAAFLYLFLVGPFANMDRSLEEAALAAGASRLRTFLTVNVRLLTPILSSVVLMGLVVGIKSFNVPLILGSPANISVLTVRILRTLQDYQPPRYSEASALALSLTLLIVGLLMVQHRMIGRRTYVTVTGKSFRRTRWELGAWRWPAAAFILLYLVLGVVLPLGSTVFCSFLPFPGVYSSFSLVNYHALFANPELPSILFNTALSAGGAGLLGVLISFGVAYAASRTHRITAAVLRGTTMLQLAKPGLVGALALIWAVALVPGLKQIYGTIWLLLIAFVVGVLPVSVQIASGAVHQLARELEDAARIGGASALRIAFGITARLLLPSLFFAWLLAVIAIVGDLDAPLLLSNAGTRTISIEVYKLFDGVDQSQAAAMMSLLLAFIVGCIALYGGLRQLIARRGDLPRLVFAEEQA